MTKTKQTTQNEIMLNNLFNGYDITEQQKKTEQKILNILKNVDKKEVKRFKKDYLNFVTRYKPKTTHQEILKMSCQISTYFEDMKTILKHLINIEFNQKTYTLKEPLTQDILRKKINLLFNNYCDILNIMRDYIRRYKAVNRGRWANDDIILKNIYRLQYYNELKKYNYIINTSKRILNKIDNFKICFKELLDYYEDNRLLKYENKMRTQAPILGRRFKKMILKGMFLNLVSPIFNTAGYEKPDKKTLDYMYINTNKILNIKHRDIKDIVDILECAISGLTDYEKIYSLYFKNM